MVESEKFTGLVCIKYENIGSRSEGPVYYLQTRTEEYLLEYEDRSPWEFDYYLEFYNRMIVEVKGVLSKEKCKIKLDRNGVNPLSKEHFPSKIE